MRVDGCWEEEEGIKGIWVYLERGTSWGKKGGDEGDEGELTRSVPVRRTPYSVLLLFTAPGSFSCNLKSERKKKRERKGNVKRVNRSSG